MKSVYFFQASVGQLEKLVSDNKKKPLKKHCVVNAMTGDPALHKHPWIYNLLQIWSDLLKQYNLKKTFEF